MDKWLKVRSAAGGGGELKIGMGKRGVGGIVFFIS